MSPAVEPFTRRAEALLRAPGHFQWSTVTLLALVVYVYSVEVQRRDWSAILAGLTFWLMDWFNEIVNAMVLHVNGDAALWTVTGASSFVILIGLTVEISLFFAINGIVFVKLLPADPGVRFAGIPNRWAVAIALSLVSVGVELLLHARGLPLALLVVERGQLPGDRGVRLPHLLRRHVPGLRRPPALPATGDRRVAGCPRPGDGADLRADPRLDLGGSPPRTRSAARPLGPTARRCGSTRPRPRPRGRRRPSRGTWRAGTPICGRPARSAAAGRTRVGSTRQRQLVRRPTRASVIRPSARPSSAALTASSSHDPAVRGLAGSRRRPVALPGRRNSTPWKRVPSSRWPADHIHSADHQSRVPHEWSRWPTPRSSIGLVADAHASR